MAQNVFKISGVIYAKPVRVVDGKEGTKNEGKTFEFPSIILEVKREYNGKTYTDLPEFELARGVNIDDFAVSDNIEITFAVGGKKVSETWHKTELRALYIKHNDTQYNDGIEVTPEAGRGKEDVFVPPNPYDKNDNLDDLPF